MKYLSLSFCLVLLLTFSKQSLAQTHNWSVLTGDSTTSYDFASCITKDMVGNIITCGWFHGNIQLDPASSLPFNLTSSRASAFIAKYSPLGVLMWAKKIEGNSYTSISAVTTDATGNIYVTGVHASSTDFDPGVGVATLVSLGSSSNMFVAKYDNNGNYVWANTAGSSGNTDEGYTIALDNMNNVIVGGHFTGTAYFDPQLGAGGSLQAISSLDAFVAKYDALGNFIWVKGWNPSKCWELSTDAVGNIYVFSEFNGTFDANPGTGVYNLSSVGDEDIFLIKLAPSGNFIWGKSLGSSAFESVGAIKCVGTNAIYICGQYGGAIDMDFGAGVNTLQGPNNNYNGYIAKYDTAGNIFWAKRIGSDSSYVRFEGLDIAANGDVTAVGEYQTYTGFIDANPGVGSYPLHTNAIAEAGLVVRLDANGIFKNAFDIETTYRLDLRNVVCDNNDNIYVAGFFTDSVYIDPNSTSLSAVSKGYEDILIAKYTYNTPSKINGVEKQAQFSLFPNPTTEKVTIAWNNTYTQVAQVAIYNVVGECILKKEGEKNSLNKTIEMPLSSIPKGMYIVKVIATDGNIESQLLHIQ